MVLSVQILQHFRVTLVLEKRHGRGLCLLEQGHLLCIGVGRFRILGGQGLENWGGPRFRILGGAKGGA